MRPHQKLARGMPEGPGFVLPHGTQAMLALAKLCVLRSKCDHMACVRSLGCRPLWSASLSLANPNFERLHYSAYFVIHQIK